MERFLSGVGHAENIPLNPTLNRGKTAQFPRVIKNRFYLFLRIYHPVVFKAQKSVVKR